MIDKELETRYLDLQKQLYLETTIQSAKESGLDDILIDKFIELMENSDTHKEVYVNTLKMYLSDEEINKVMESALTVYEITKDHHKVFAEKAAELFISKNEEAFDKILANTDLQKS